MEYRQKVQAALDDHNPRPVGDPLYVPYWARGAYARAHSTQYTMQDGTHLVAGRIERLGKEASRSASSSEELPQYRAPVERPTESPRSTVAVLSRGASTPTREPDAVTVLLRQHSTKESRMALCAKHGIDWALVESAPNPGVGAMRLANALRSRLG